MYYTYVLIIPTTLACLLFGTAIPTSLFNLSNYFLYLSVFIFYDLRSFRYFDKFQ